MHYTKENISSLERFYRANLINSSTGFKPANLIGTISNESLPNLAIFSSVVHLGSDPALIAFIQRPLIDTSHTYQNIIDTGYYTINHVPITMTKEAHQTSGKYVENEFPICGLNEEYIEDFIAPFVAQSKVKLGMKFVEEIFIKHNNTRMMIGEVQHLVVSDDCVNEDGTIMLDKAESAVVAGLDTYHSTTFIDKYGYVKI